MSEVRDTVRHFVIERFVADPDVQLSDDTDLLESGILDSFSLLTLVTFIESRFRIKLGRSDLSSGSLSSVSNIERLVRARTTGER